MTYSSTPARCPLVILALLCSAPIVHASAHVSQTETHNEDVVRRSFEAWSSGTGHVFDILSPDIRWTVARSGPFTGTFIGKEDFRNRAAAPLVDRLSDDDARHSLRLTSDMELVMAMQRRGKDLSRRPDLLKETTNRAFDKLALKPLREPVVHSAATMKAVVAAPTKARTEIYKR